MPLSSPEKKNDIEMKKAALIDMDGVLYDSMKLHTLAWYRMMTELGIPCKRDEFYLYEGMTGKATINRLFQRAYGRDASQEEADELYQRKSQIFRELGERQVMPGAQKLMRRLGEMGLRRILVTGSAQHSLLDSLNIDYPGVFAPGDRVTALNVTHGKPHPEPYLKGLEIAGVRPEEAIVIENAPLGVLAGKAAGIQTVAITTGPIPREEFVKAGADLIFPSMPEAAENFSLDLL
ncbi:MAG: HAD-IA family hydrolase [Muribaculaceae bacterium]|nr:HAD-IA family hydrolase [Muribaculaceae bacterium]